MDRLDGRQTRYIAVLQGKPSQRRQTSLGKDIRRIETEDKNARHEEQNSASRNRNIMTTDFKLLDRHHNVASQLPIQALFQVPIEAPFASCSVSPYELQR